MNAQPARRPSSITRPQHPARAAAEAALAAEDPPPAARSADKRPPTNGSATERARLRDGRVSYAGRAGTVYFPDAASRQRVKAAFLARGGAEGYLSETEWWADVILSAAEQWETDHNNGNPYKVAERLSRRSASQ